jgi:hypothetical protein
MGEMDFDGIQELVVGYQNDFGPSRTVGIFKRNGGGVLQPPTFYDAGTYARSIALGDFTGDGLLDVGTASYADIGGDRRLHEHGGSARQLLRRARQRERILDPGLAPGRLQRRLQSRWTARHRHIGLGHSDLGRQR